MKLLILLNILRHFFDHNMILDFISSIVTLFNILDANIIADEDYEKLLRIWRNQNFKEGLK